MYSPCVYSRYTKNDTPALSAPEFIAKPNSESPEGGDGLGAGMTHPG